MKKLIFTILLLALLPLFSLKSQPVFYSEGFENNDSLSLPAGWSKWNAAAFPIDPLWNWTVRDTGVCMPGITCTRTSTAKEGRKSVMVTWYSSQDTLALDTTYTAKAWLVTKQFRNLPTDATLSYWACGGSTSYLDSMNIWISTTDSLPSSFTNYLNTNSWPAGSVFGLFQNYIEDLSVYAGQNIRIGFQYNTNGNTDGYVAFLDKFEMLGTVGVKPIGTNLPKTFALGQNYPNPFNPVTNINFDLPRNSLVRLEVFDNLGRLVNTLHNGELRAGSYEYQFFASNLPSGVYFYRLTADNFVDTKRMMVLK